MPPRVFLAVAGLAGAISVAMDAIGRHLLAGDPHRLDLATTSARYGLVHAAALLGLALLGAGRSGGAFLGAAAWCFVGGIVLFCGSLDLLALGAPPGLAAAAPWGGSLFILGWLALFAAALRPKRV